DRQRPAGAGREVGAHAPRPVSRRARQGPGPLARAVAARRHSGHAQPTLGHGARGDAVCRALPTGARPPQEAGGAEPLDAGTAARLPADGPSLPPHRGMSRSGSDSLAIAELAGKRICLVLLTGLGDVVMGLPVANALKRHVPGVHVTWVAEPMPAGVLRGHPAVDRIVVYEKKKGVRGLLGLREALKGGEFDLTLNLNYYFK